ncbi:PPK2 family polyphosphate kinase [Massilia sp. GCM10020059]|uniref:Polyphosphate kinase 2 family protein n=1 Tax=Massilia agrisoli TaxID=2892444 RepID=A0ABS8IPH6_9BURK|nr:PPK2 family polyphosphate kinase [Massilia agrisoli]MCC6070275.1 polyphosphate kinase 2 family protein [Massilia agrisoli]
MKAREQFRVPKHFALRDEDAGAKPLRDGAAGQGLDKDQVKQRERELTTQLIEQVAVCQEMLYAQRKHKVLLILQGPDTSGKDGTIKSLFSHINPIGLRAVAFRAPSDDERAHDFLWRVHRHVPVQGEIAIFNRSHYEDVLVPLVHGEIDGQEVARRYGHIRDFERMLVETGTLVVKIFLHISSDEQRKRLQSRIDDPDKQWKFDPMDVAKRKHWGDYQRAYEQAISATDTDDAPWYIIPADSKTHRNLMVATLLLEIMQGLKLQFPEPDRKLSKLKIE